MVLIVGRLEFCYASFFFSRSRIHTLTARTEKNNNKHSNRSLSRKNARFSVRQTKQNSEDCFDGFYHQNSCEQSVRLLGLLQRWFNRFGCFRNMQVAKCSCFLLSSLLMHFHTCTLAPIFLLLPLLSLCYFTHTHSTHHTHLPILFAAPSFSAIRSSWGLGLFNCHALDTAQPRSGKWVTHAELIDIYQSSTATARTHAVWRCRSWWRLSRHAMNHMPCACSDAVWEGGTASLMIGLTCPVEWNGTKLD